jgi:hypothetical protein
VLSLDEEASRVLRDRIDTVHAAAGLLADVAARNRWLDTLARVAAASPPLIAGRLTRLLLDAGRLSAGQAATRMSRELSAAAPAADAASWAEGFLAGSGLLLVHDEALLSLADGWLSGLTGDAFTAVLPALRRTFGGFGRPGWTAPASRRLRTPPPTTTWTRTGPRGPWRRSRPSSAPARGRRRDRRARRADAALAAGPGRRRRHRGDSG